MPKPKDATTSRAAYRRAWREASKAAAESWKRCRALYEEKES